MEYEDIVHRCFRCGWCKFPSTYLDFNCPPYQKYQLDTYSPAGRMWLINGWLNGEVETSRHFAEILYSCVNCGNCEEQCPFYKFNGNLLDVFEKSKEELIKNGFVLPSVRDFLKAVQVHGNSYGINRKRRGEWAKETDIELFSDQDFLFYVGDVGSFDDLGKEMAESVGTLLSELSLSIGILGKEEISDGNDVKACGETGLFEDLAEKNIQTFNQKGIEKIITLDPHAYNAFSQYYPSFGGEFEVQHFTQTLARLIREENPSFKERDLSVTYHDPCYLGRHNNIYDAPREILESIPDLELVEMERNKEDAFCCGGGGGNIFTDVLESSGKNAPGRIRVREALETGVDILAVACPSCFRMLSDAVKDEGMEDELEVKNIADIVGNAV